MSDEVCFAARMPASRAVCSGSPFLTRPDRINRRASADIAIDPRAIASRVVTGLSPTSTICTRPRASTCVSLRFAIALGEEERQALERDGQIDALQLDVRRHLKRARREVQDRLDARADALLQDWLRRRRRNRDDGDLDGVAACDLLQVVDVVNENAAARVL